METAIKKRLLLLLLFLSSSLSLSLSSSSSEFNIDDYGAVRDVNSPSAAVANAAALQAALEAAAAAAATASSGATAVVPAGATFVSLPAGGAGYNGVTLRVDGVLKACDLKECRNAWPSNGGSAYKPFLQLDNCTDFSLTGEGTIDGQGYL